jgi:hypothetical protein
VALNDYGKLWLLALVMVLGTVAGCVLLLAGAVTEATGAAIITACLTGPLGYLTGNGRAATRAEAPSPVFVPDPAKVAEVAAAADAAHQLGDAGGHVRVLGPDERPSG